MIHDGLVVQHRPEENEQQTDDKDSDDRNNDRLGNVCFAEEDYPAETGCPDNGNCHHCVDGKIRLVFQSRFEIFT